MGQDFDSFVPEGKAEYSQMVELRGKCPVSKLSSGAENIAAIPKARHGQIRIKALMK